MLWNDHYSFSRSLAAWFFGRNISRNFQKQAVGFTL